MGRSYRIPYAGRSSKKAGPEGPAGGVGSGRAAEDPTSNSGVDRLRHRLRLIAVDEKSQADAAL